jgi:ATP-binding protein involved in chromosome partitioning
MKIAIPTRDGTLCAHFGHCEEFTFFELDQETKQITHSERIAAPAHEPGLLPRWLREHGAELVIAGGMGMRARMIFAENGVEVVVGAAEAPPQELAQSYMNGTLALGENVCDH